MTRIFMLITAGLLLGTAACHPNQAQAKKIVLQDLGNPSFADFRRLRTKPGNASIVCGEVDASDHPGGGGGVPS